MKFNFKTIFTEEEIRERLTAISESKFSDDEFLSILRFNLSTLRTNLIWNNTLIQFWLKSIIIDIRLENFNGSTEVYLNARANDVSKAFAFLILTVVFTGFVSQFSDNDFLYIIMQFPIGLLIISPWALAMWLVNRSEKRRAIKLILQQFVTPNNR